MKRYQKFMYWMMAFFLIIGCYSFLCGVERQQVEAAKGDRVIDGVFVVNGTKLRDYTGKAEHVVVPDGITSIGRSAFASCKAKTIALPNSVVEIESCSFQYASSLEKVTFSKNVKKIGSMAFWDCEKLREISSMKGVEEIGSSAFFNTIWLKEKQKQNPLVIVNTILVDGSACKGEVEVPNTVTKTGEDAFDFNEELTSITIPNSVKEIGGGCFHGCRYLRTVKMGDGVEKIGSQAFRYCTRLKNIRLSKSLKEIESLTFEICSRLEEITIPDSVEVLSIQAFYGCKKLKSITLPNSFKILDGLGALGVYDVKVTVYGQDVEKNLWIRKIAEENEVEVKELALTDSKKRLKQNETYRLKFNSGAKCTWKSSNRSVATVNHYGIITTNEKGTATITAHLNGRDYTCKIIVE